MAKDALYRVGRAARELAREVERLDDDEYDEARMELDALAAATGELFRRLAELVAGELERRS